MKLYELATSASAARVGIFLREIGVEIESVSVDIRGGENLTPEFLGKSANGLIPLLELDNGDYIGESVAICRYLEALNKPSHSLFGDTALEQAKVEMWHRMVELKGLFLAFQSFRNTSGVYADRENIVPAWGEEARLRVEQFLPVLEKQLTDNEYIAGANFSIVDISAFVMLNVCKAIKIELPEEFTGIQRWHALVANRPSIKQ